MFSPVSLHKMMPFIFLLVLTSIAARAENQAHTQGEQLKASVAFYTYSSQYLTLTIYISPSTTYAVGSDIPSATGESSTPEDVADQGQGGERLRTDEPFFSATDASGSVTVLPGSIVPSDVMSSLLGSSLPTTLVTATDASPTPTAETGGRETWTLGTSWIQPDKTSSLPLTWTVTQNGTTRTVVPTTTKIHQSTETASVGSTGSPPVGLGWFPQSLVLEETRVCSLLMRCLDCALGTLCCGRRFSLVVRRCLRWFRGKWTLILNHVGHHGFLLRGPITIWRTRNVVLASCIQNLGWVSQRNFRCDSLAGIMCL